ncbi:hypothetical protein KCV00_g324, partial [Aureobasidium melanogenum]
MAKDMSLVKTFEQACHDDAFGRLGTAVRAGHKQKRGSDKGTAVTIFKCLDSATRSGVDAVEACFDVGLVGTITVVAADAAKGRGLGSTRPTGVRG